MSQFFFGKLAPKEHPHTLKLSSILREDALILPPTKTYWEYKVPDDWGMLGNDRYGDCVFAAIAHMIMNWTAHTGKMFTPSLGDVLKAYHDVTGFDPYSGVNDNGTAMTDAYDYWKNVGIAGHKIDGWAQIDWKNKKHVMLAIYLFGGVNPGIVMPQSALHQFDAGLHWHVEEDDMGIVGGHSVPYFGYGSEGGTGITWGKRQPTSWEFWDKYVEECYVPLSLDWIKSTKEAPNHLKMDELEDMLKKIRT